MGREVKRVPLDFPWPLNKKWWGYINPFSDAALPCEACDQSGLSPEAKQVSDDWYDFAKTGRRWCHDITQDEVDALIADNRLYDLTHVWNDGKWERVRTIVTAKEVNEWSRGPGFGHDAINQWICVKARCKRLDIESTSCPQCGGDGEIWSHPIAKKWSEDWQQIEPPTGDALQIWETVSEGSPISPPFATPEELAQWMTKHPWGGDREISYESWMKFIVGKGWAPSMVMSSRGIESGVEFVANQEGTR